MALTALTRPGEEEIVAPLPTARTITGVGATTIHTIGVSVLVLSGRRRRKREAGVGVEVGVGAGQGAEPGTASLHHTAVKAKEEERGEGSEVGLNRV